MNTNRFYKEQNRPMSTDITRYSPHQPVTSEPNPLIDATVTAAFELIQMRNPRRYQKIERQRTLFQAQQPVITAKLNDPTVTKMIEALKAKRIASQMSDEFALLGIDASATKRDVKNAYRRKARKLHPDMGGDAEAFKQMYVAYRTLLKVTHD